MKTPRLIHHFHHFLTIGCAVAAVVLLRGEARASTNVFNFDSDPSGILNVTRDGDTPELQNLAGVWFSSGGSPLETGVGDQSTNGYFAITQTTPSLSAHGMGSVIIFNDFDSGLIVAGFTFSCDVRIGAGSDQPADGFSLNYARANDPVLSGGSFSSGPNGNPGNAKEEGTTTGLAISFDAYDNSADDTIGLTLKVDGNIITNIAMPTLNGACADATSLQTGPNNGGVGALCWQPLFVQLTTTGLINVSYKGVAFLTNYSVPFAPGAGRLIFAGRTGGLWEEQDVDNIRIETIPSADPVVGPVIANANGFKFTISDSGPATPDTNTITLSLDGAPVTPTSIFQDGSGLTTVTFQDPARLLGSGTTHTARVQFTGFNFSGTVDVHQLPIHRFPSGSSLIGIERQLADGFIDPATGQPYASVTAGGVTNFTVDDVINWGQNVAIDPFDQVGFFRDISPPPADWADQPIPGTDRAASDPDNLAAELLTILYLPAGAYQLGVLSDDGFKLTAGAEPRDMFGATFLMSREAANIETLANVVVTNAGYYPVRIAWGENVGGAQLEFYLVDFSTGNRILINDQRHPVQIVSYRDTAALTQPYVRWTSPAPAETGVRADAPVIVKFMDGTAASIMDGSIRILLNGIGGAPAISNSGTETTATLAGAGVVPAGSTNTVTLTYSTSAGGPFTDTWQFVAAPYASLPVGLRTPVGSGDAAQPGFRASVWQLGDNQFANFQNQNDSADMVLLGLWGTNNATLSSFTEPGVINYGIANEGSFTNAVNSLPGLPGSDGTQDNVAYAFLTYVEFPAAGLYQMGVQSDDGFRLTPGDTAGPSVPWLTVVPPSSPDITRRYGTVPTFLPRDGFGGPIPASGLAARLVVADPLLAGGPLTNASAVAGNVALVARGTFGFAVKAKNVQDAGAVAMILYNATQTNGLPQIMSGADTNVTIPCLMISYGDGTNLLAHATTGAGSPVFVNLSPGDQRLVIGEFSGGRGADTPTEFGLYVPQAGVYPLRLMYEQGGGGASVEWWTETPLGVRYLINDSSSASALKAYRARTVAGGPPRFDAMGRSGNAVTFSWTGVGEVDQAPALTGRWITATNQGNPQTNSTSAAPRLFYRLRQY
ncbi:MAG: hypothetical protein JF609_09350 [Verrucomicrobia bacterium]|nr:hypothetical protein [Verrucomicrobiota bacterium]